MRAVLDKLISWTGFALAAVLLIAGGLLTWANLFIADQVEEQLSAQNIVMPEGGALESLPEADREALEEFAGEPLTTGPQARAYADHYIQAHMNASSDGRAYSEVSNAARELAADPNADPAAVEEAGALKESLFQGNTLRGLLLYGFAFATMGTIAGYAAIASFAGGALFLVLAFLGIRHARKVATDEAQREPALV